jgi:hypothetical protein
MDRDPVFAERPPVNDLGAKLFNVEFSQFLPISAENVNVIKPIIGHQKTSSYFLSFHFSSNSNYCLDFSWPPGL